MRRPLPPDGLADPDRLAACFLPAPELARWATETFVEQGGALCNPEHSHLESAEIGFLWTSVENVSKGRAGSGTAELPAEPCAGNKWAKARGPGNRCMGGSASCRAS